MSDSEDSDKTKPDKKAKKEDAVGLKKEEHGALRREEPGGQSRIDFGGPSRLDLRAEPKHARRKSDANDGLHHHRENLSRMDVSTKRDHQSRIDLGGFDKKLQAKSGHSLAAQTDKEEASTSRTEDKGCFSFVRKMICGKTEKSEGEEDENYKKIKEEEKIRKLKKDMFK